MKQVLLSCVYLVCASHFSCAQDEATNNRLSPISVEKSSFGLKPIIDMHERDRYQTQDGGLYGRGINTVPAELSAVVLRESSKIVPLDADGRPSSGGKIVIAAMSMSNAEQEFGVFQQLASADAAKSPQVVIVNTAQGGRAMSAWALPRYRTFEIAQQRLETAGVTTKQVQVVWIKLAIELLDFRPIGSSDPKNVDENMRRVRADTRLVLQESMKRFPNLRIAYLGSRTYGGYCNTDLNPEPYAYESGFAARAMILDQIKGDPALNYDPAKGKVVAPLLLWGPYLWADGVSPRNADGMQWLRSDFGRDGVHPSRAGEEKVAQLLLDFFKNDISAKHWFTRN